jgi:glucokinase
VTSGTPIGVVDLGGTKIYSAVLDAQGKVLGDDLRPTEAALGVASVIDRVILSLSEAAARAQVGLSALGGVGIAAPGPVVFSTGHIINPPNLPGWGDVALGPMLRERLGLRVVVENDAKAAAYGEYLEGAGRGARAMVFVTVSTGIGGAVVLDGKLYRGVDGAAGEVGHTIVVTGGPLCGCGRHGCLEAVASGTALAREGQAAILDGRAPILRRLAAVADGEVTAGLIAAAAAEGDAAAREIITRAAELLGTGLGNLVNIFNPDLIVLGGGVTRIGTPLLAPAEAAMREVALALPRRSVQLRLAALEYPAIQGLAGSIAAAASPASS